MATATVSACGVLTSSFAACSSEEAESPRLEGRYEAVLDPNLQLDNIWFSSDGRYHAWKAGCFDDSCHERGTFKLDVDAATLALAPESGATRLYALSAVPEAADPRPASALRSSRSVLTPRAEGDTAAPGGGGAGGSPSCAPGDGTGGSKASGPSTKSLRPLEEGSNLIGGGQGNLVGGGGGALIGEGDPLISVCVNLTVGKAGLLTDGAGLIVSLNISLIIGGGRGSSDSKEPASQKDGGSSNESSPMDGGGGGSQSGGSPGGGSPGGGSPGGGSPGGGSPGGGSPGGGSPGGGSPGGESPGGGTADGGPSGGGSSGGGSQATPTPLKRTGANDAPVSTTKGSGTGKTVEQAVQDRAACDTDNVLTITKQIAEQMFCLADKVQPGAYVDLRGHQGLTFANHAIPYLQKPSAEALFDAAKKRPIRVEHATRALSSQYMLFTQGQQGRCGIGRVAEVNKSPHEEGIAVDLVNWDEVLEPMAAAKWDHSNPKDDAVHFQMLQVPQTFYGYSARAFQTLWNINHPEDKLDVDGIAGDATIDRLKKSPAGGFAKGADCSGTTAGGTQPKPGPAPTTPPPGNSTASGFDFAKEVDPHGGPNGTFGKLAIAIGYAEGTVELTGQLKPEYNGHGDSGLNNIGIWSCTVCGSGRGEAAGRAADDLYFNDKIKPAFKEFRELSNNADTAWMVRQPMVAALFFGLVTQSPEATFKDLNSSDLSLFTRLKRGQLTPPATHEKLRTVLFASWQKNGFIDDIRKDDQERRLLAYAASLKAQGFVNPFATP